MNIIIEYVFINPELDEIKNIKKNTIKDYIKKYGNSYWKRLDYKYNIRFFDKTKKNMENITTRHGPNRTKVASNGRYEYVEMNNFIILIEGNIKKKVISTYMKCGKISLLWGKIFLKIAYNRDYIINYCNRPFNNFDKLCPEWYLSHNSDDNEIRALDDKYMLML